MNIPTQRAPSRAPIRCLIVQLARLGDTLQSLMALRAAKQLYPNLEIHFLARERFAGAAKRVPWLEKVITFPTDDLLSPVLSGEKTETLALGDLARWIAPLVKDPWDVVVNWSFSEASSYLTALIPSRVKLGFTRRRDSTFSGADGWTHYVQAIVQGGIHQNIHLTDILTTQFLTALQIHVGEPSSDGNAPVTSKGFFSLSLKKRELHEQLKDPSKKWIAIQLGAGQEAKTWGAKNWGRLARLLLERNPDVRIILLGGEEDREKLRQFLNESGENRSIVPLIGQTEFDYWASIVSSCQWLFAGDTAAIHLASVLGTRVLNVSIGPVRHLETGPYGNGHYIVSSDLDCEACETESPQSGHSCRNHISPESIYAVWTYASQEWTHRRQFSLESYFAQLGWTEHLERIRVFRSKIRATQDGGGVVYESIVKKTLRLNEWTAMVMGHVARSWYCGWTPPVGKELERQSLSPLLMKKLREMKDSLAVLSQICEKAARTASDLNKKGVSLKSDRVMGIQDKEEVQSLGKTLLELETLMDRIAKTQPPLAAFSLMSKVLMHNLRSTQLADIGRETHNCYRQLHDGVQIYKEWVSSHLQSNTTTPSKPIKATRSALHYARNLASVTGGTPFIPN